MSCYTFFVTPTISESENFKIAMKRIDDEEYEDFGKEKYFNFERLIFVKVSNFYHSPNLTKCIKRQIKSTPEIAFRPFAKFIHAIVNPLNSSS